MKLIFNWFLALVAIVVCVSAIYLLLSAKVPGSQKPSSDFLSFCASRGGIVATNAAGSVGCELKSGITIPQE